MDGNLFGLLTSLEKRVTKLLKDALNSSHLRVVMDHDDLALLNKSIENNLIELKKTLEEYHEKTSVISFREYQLKRQVEEQAKIIESLKGVEAENRELRSLVNQTSYSERFVDSSLKGKLVFFSDLQNRKKLNKVA